METPSEWAKRFNQQKADSEAGSPKPEVEAADNPAPLAEFPSEPFQCPACGQLLAPTCRVCVACKHPINPAEIARPREVAMPAAPAPGTGSRPETVRYPWRIFFAVFGSAFFLVLLFKGVWGEERAQLAWAGVQTLVGVWVFFDALRQRVPRPLRWAVGSMLPIIIFLVFPWYLARRSKPQSTVPFVEAEVGPVTRFLLIALFIFFLASMIFYIVQGPPPALAPPPQPPEHKSGGANQARINNFRPGKENGPGRRALEGSHGLPYASSAQAETSAPSDAWQT